MLSSLISVRASALISAEKGVSTLIYWGKGLKSSLICGAKADSSLISEDFWYLLYLRYPKLVREKISTN